MYVNNNRINKPWDALPKKQPGAQQSPAPFPHAVAGS